ncbi:invasion associated locus B family protein [Arsenicitalea aurantiaca]|uniref:invasion associated locus B family protein n=1 Tax=Arsenicitalea aurantiaca TaxID=1783274 RepID=UPI001FCED646|nr:invasion associated locus B family protein [Arsenicitalea aurantiaca]
MLTVELRATEGDAVGGVLVLPFGLNLDDGVSLAIDDAAPFGSLRFSTCLPVGCLLPFDFDANAVAAMRAGNAIAVHAAASETGQEVALSISLVGFPSALARVVAFDGS